MYGIKNLVVMIHLAALRMNPVHSSTLITFGALQPLLKSRVCVVHRRPISSLRHLPQSHNVPVHTVRKTLAGAACSACGKNHKRMPKYAIIDCEDEPKWDDEGPDDLWRRQLEEHSDGPTGEKSSAESWVTYRAYLGEIPSKADGIDGAIIPGSHYSVYENKPWMQALKQYVRDCYVPWTANWSDPEHSWKPMIVGSCFGHQLIAEAMGGHVCPNPRGKYIVKAEELYPTEAFCRMPWADSIVLKTKDGPMIQVNEIAWSRNVETGALPFMRITETHGDSVVTLPADAQVLAVSDSSTNELFLVGRNLLAYQSHPEFTWENQLLTKVIPYVYPARMDDDERLEADESFSKPLHSDALIEITRRFLKGDYFERPKASQLPGELYTCEADAEASRYNVPEGYPEEIVGGMTAEEEEAEILDGGLPTEMRYPGTAHRSEIGEDGEARIDATGFSALRPTSPPTITVPSPSGRRMYSTAGTRGSPLGQDTEEGTPDVTNGHSSNGGPNLHAEDERQGKGTAAGMNTKPLSAETLNAVGADPEGEGVIGQDAGGPAGVLWSLLERAGIVATDQRAGEGGHQQK